MKTAGIIGGVSWHSSMQMYEQINRHVAERLGGLNCAKLVMVNVNLNDIIQAPTPAEKGAVLHAAAIQAERAGASFLAIGSNGLHQYANIFLKDIGIPFVHIADATADAIAAAGYKKVGLVGVRETMEKSFYKGRLTCRGFDVLVPNEQTREYIDHVLFHETGVGVVNPESSRRFYQIAEELVSRGAECVILGCTEIGMLMQQEHTEIPLFDTTLIHAETIANLCMED